MGTSLYDQYLKEQSPAPDLYAQYVAESAKVTAGPISLAPQDTPRAATPTIRATPDEPGVLRTVAGVASDLVTAPVRSALTLLDTPVEGEEISAARANRGKGGVIDPTGKLLRVGAPGGPAPVVSGQNTSGAIPERELNRAGVETVGNAALSAIPVGAFGRAAGPAGTLVGRVARAGLRGAVHGAVVNGALGGAEGLALGDDQGTNRLSAAATGAERGAMIGALAGGVFGSGGSLAGEGLSAMSARRAAQSARAIESRAVPTPPEALPGQADALMGRVPFSEPPAALAEKAEARALRQRVTPTVQRTVAPAPAPVTDVVPMDEHLAMLDARDAAEAAAGPAGAIEPVAVPSVRDEPASVGEPIPAATVRMYHGGNPNTEGGARFFSSDPKYADGYARKAGEGAQTWYVDVPADHPLIKPEYPEQSVARGYTVNAELPAEIASQMQPVPPPPEPIPAPRRTATAARFPSGKLRPLHLVTDEALLDEHDALLGRLERDQPQTIYQFTPDDSFHGTEDGRSVLHKTVTARGTSQQAEALNRVAQSRTQLDKVQAELASRGVDPTEHYLARAADPAAEEERRALAGAIPAQADASFDFGANLGDDYQEHFSGLGLTSKMKRALKQTVRHAVSTPYAEIEQSHPDLAAALMRSGASESKALHIATARVDDVLAGLTPEQAQHFGPTLVRSRLTDAAERAEKAALAEPDPTIRAEHQAEADRFRQHAADLDQHIPIGFDQQPDVQAAIQRHKDLIVARGDVDATGAGVSPTSLVQPEHGYIKLVDKQKAEDNLRRRVLKSLGKKDVSEVTPRSALGRALLGEKRGVRDLYRQGAPVPASGPVQPAQGSYNQASQGYPGEPRAVTRQRVGITKSAQHATGSAREYETDYRRIIAYDARDKAMKSARNNVYREIATLGRPLIDGEGPTGANEVLSFDDGKGLITTGTMTAPGAQRFEVSPEVHGAVTRYHQQTEGRVQSGLGRAYRRLTGALTHAQIAGMPVEATSHANTLASVVASVPGENTVGRKVTAALPGLGGKAAALTEMYKLDFRDPATRALEYRLADAGALRVEEHTGGLLNTSHHWLFGREGIDARGRLVLARKYLDRDPNASDEALRDFITGKLGNYVRANSGTLVNALQESGLASFARFQAARIPTSIKAAFGYSGLPTTNAAQAVTDHLATLYRGPVGHVLGANLLNYAATGHSTFTNERGHALDVETPFVATPQGMKWAGHHPERLTAQFGEGARPVYAPGATLNPVAVGGLRSSGLKALLFSPREDGTGRMADAERDVVNTAAGVLSPAAKFATAALLGRTPYFQQDGSMLRTAQPRFNEDREARDRVWEAAVSANPATGAMLGNAGEAGGRSLAGALSQDGRTFGGPEAVAARAAEFLLPRIASPGVGGLRNAAAAENQKRAHKEEVMSAYKFRLRGAPGPQAADAIVREAVDDAASIGMTGPALAAELRRYARMPDAARAAQAAKQARKFEGKYERGTTDAPRTTYVPGLP